jgi:hypothetical protein
MSSRWRGRREDKARVKGLTADLFRSDEVRNKLFQALWQRQTPELDKAKARISALETELLVVRMLKATATIGGGKGSVRSKIEKVNELALDYNRRLKELDEKEAKLDRLLAIQKAS